MKKNIILIFIFLNILIFAEEVAYLPIIVRGTVIPKTTKVISTINHNLQEIKLTNPFSKDIYIIGNGDKKPFLYKIKAGEEKNYRIKCKNIENLSYILDYKKFKLNTYEDIYK